MSGARLVLVAVAAALVLSCAIGVASANRISVSSADIEAQWEDMRFINNAGFSTIRCRVSISGRLDDATFPKAVGLHLGEITGVTVGTCTGGNVTVLAADLPWNVKLMAYEGTLPRIIEIIVHVEGFRFRTRPSGPGTPPTCLFWAEPEGPMELRLWLGMGNGTVTTIEPVGWIEAIGGDILCFFGVEVITESGFEGTFSVPGRTTPITMVLI